MSTLGKSKKHREILGKSLRELSKPPHGKQSSNSVGELGLV